MAGMLSTGPMRPEQVREALLSLPENERSFIISDSKPGQHKVIAIRRNTGNVLEYDYEEETE